MGSIVRARNSFTTFAHRAENILRAALDNVYSNHLLGNQCIDLQFVFTFLVLVNLFILELGRNYFASSQVLLQVTLRRKKANVWILHKPKTNERANFWELFRLFYSCDAYPFTLESLWLLLLLTKHLNQRRMESAKGKTKQKIFSSSHDCCKSRQKHFFCSAALLCWFPPARYKSKYLYECFIP